MRKVFFSLLVIALVACNKNAVETKDVYTDSSRTVETDTVTIPQTAQNKESLLKDANEKVLQALKNKNYRKLSELIHPEKGVRFSMYAFINKSEDKHFSKADFDKYEPTKTIFTWGALDGSGELYKATINEYLTQWVYAKDFNKSNFSVNKFQGGGNSLNNLNEIYPDSDFTENFIKGSEANAEMDWNTLRLVFEKFQDQYFLVAVINDQWTI